MSQDTEIYAQLGGFIRETYFSDDHRGEEVFPVVDELGFVIASN